MSSSNKVPYEMRLNVEFVLLIEVVPEDVEVYRKRILQETDYYYTAKKRST